jgi:hypothetical protein
MKQQNHLNSITTQVIQNGMDGPVGLLDETQD